MLVKIVVERSASRSIPAIKEELKRFEVDVQICTRSPLALGGPTVESIPSAYRLAPLPPPLTDPGKPTNAGHGGPTGHVRRR